MLALLLAASAIDWPLTTPEKSNFEKTSTYAEVVDFMETLEKLGAPGKLTWIGESTEGRKIPLMIVSDPPVANASEARASGKLIVYIQGNIHAGEVEGKESAQMLLRDIAQKHAAKKPTLLKNMVLLVNPIYNADGNEKFGPVERNRPEQDGPGLVGLRPNGQGLDLNRDCIKAESPEMRAALEHIFNKWDPDAVMDLHTTDGTRHGYELTYSPPLNPNTDPAILRYAQEKLLPDVRREVLKKHKLELFDYGNAERANGATAWRSFGQEARYVTNYAGVCNRVGILSEATVYIPFKDRIFATNYFMDAVLAHLAKNAAAVIKMRKASTLPKELGVRFEMAQGREESVLLEKLAEGAPRPRGGRPKEVEGVKMPVFDRFKTVKSATVPTAYFIPETQSAAIRLLQRHGILLKKAIENEVGTGQRFVVTEFNQDRQAFQGHKLIRLEGRFEPGGFDAKATPGYLVSMNQPLARLAFHLLEPESLDGVYAWGFMGEAFKPGDTLPIVKVNFVDLTRSIP